MLNSYNSLLLMSSVGSVVSQVLKHKQVLLAVKTCWQMCPSAGKGITTPPLLCLSTRFPRLMIRLKERSESRDAFSQENQSQLTMPLKRVKGNRNRGNNNAIVAIFVSITANPNIQKSLLCGCLTLTLTNVYLGKVNFISQLSSDILNTL